MTLDTATDWASILVPALGLIVAAALIRPSIRASTAASRSAEQAAQHLDHLVRQTNADRAEAAERVARQLDVYWGHDRLEPGQDPSHVVMIMNRGDYAVYDLVLSVAAPLQSLSLQVPMVPPGRWRTRLDPENNPQRQFGPVKPADDNRFSLERDRAYEVIEYSFADSTGVRWTNSRAAGLRKAGVAD